MVVSTIQRVIDAGQRCGGRSIRAERKSARVRHTTVSMTLDRHHVIPTHSLYRVPVLQTHRADVRCRAGEGLPPELKQSIDDFVQENTVVVFMKGTKDMPMCGFSNTVVQILNQLNVPYVTVNVLENDVLRNGMKEYSMWPTFPQVYVSGEFYGGCDIMIESYTSGELQEALEIALLS